MSKRNRINLDPVPDIHTHDFTIYALNEIYENQIKFDKKLRKVRRGSNVKFILLSAAFGYILEKIRKLEEPKKE